MLGMHFSAPGTYNFPPGNMKSACVSTPQKITDRETTRSPWGASQLGSNPYVILNFEYAECGPCRAFCLMPLCSCFHFSATDYPAFGHFNCDTPCIHLRGPFRHLRDLALNFARRNEWPYNNLNDLAPSLYPQAHDNEKDHRIE